METDVVTLEAGLAHEVFCGSGKGADMQVPIAAFTARHPPGGR